MGVHLLEGGAASTFAAPPPCFLTYLAFERGRLAAPLVRFAHEGGTTRFALPLRFFFTYVPFERGRLAAPVLGFTHQGGK